MIIALIAAMAENRIIGNANTIPWDLPADRQRFRSITMGHPLIMGRKTYESIGKPLPGRKTVIITRNKNYRSAGCVVAHSLEEALAGCADADEVCICGGGEIYREALQLASVIYLTVLHRKVNGDTLFPEIPDDFIEVKREAAAATSPCTFIRYERRKR
jgi:dihydrofolate reductase